MSIGGKNSGSGSSGPGGAKMTPKNSSTGNKSSGKSKLTKTAQNKKTILKVSSNIFSSKLKKRKASNQGDNRRKSTENVKMSETTTSSHENKKAESKSVKNVKKPKKDCKDVSAKKLKQTDPEGKVKKRKLDKKTLAKRKLNRMKKQGYLAAPPRRSAALNASAIMNCIFDKQTAIAAPSKQIKIKERDRNGIFETP